MEKGALIVKEILQMIERWQAGYEVVYGIRTLGTPNVEPFSAKKKYSTQ